MSSAPQGPYRVEGSDAFGWRVFGPSGSVSRLWSLQSHAQNACDAANTGYHEGRESVMAVLRELEADADQYRYSVEAHFPQNSKEDTARLIAAQVAADELLNPNPPTYVPV